MQRRTFLLSGSASILALSTGCWSSSGPRLLNASYDATRELYRDIDRAFVARYSAHHGIDVSVRPSHGGSSSQARAVLDGLPADVVTLSNYPDIEVLAEQGLVQSDWLHALPNRSLPYTSTIVMVVRAGNPLGISDWSDLVRSNASIVVANPKISGLARLAVIAAWGATRLRTGSERQADELVTAIYRQVPALENSARSAAVAFVRKQIGNVHITWENEAHLILKHSKEKLQIVYPQQCLIAEPHVAMVDANAQRNNTVELASDYLHFLYEPTAQWIIADNGYRPAVMKIPDEFQAHYPPLSQPFLATELPGLSTWDALQNRFFAQGALFDSIYRNS